MSHHKSTRVLSGADGEVEMKGKEQKAVSMFDTGEYLTCREAFSLNRIGLSYRKTGSIRSKVLTPLMKEFQQIVKLSRDEFNSFIRTKVDELYTEDLQEIKIGLDEEKDLFIRKFIRMADYLRNLMVKKEGEKEVPFGKGRISFYIPFTADVTGLFGDDIMTVKDYVDFLFTVDGKTTAVRVIDGENKTSPRAVKEANLPQNKTELALSYLGLAIGESDNIAVEEWYLTSKKDKNSELAEYERKPGENIASVSYRSRQEAVDALRKSINASKPGECERCRHRLVCSKCMAPMNLETKVAKDIVATQAKEPVFTKAQQKVVQYGDGPMVVVAVPGAGKTTSLVHRLKRLIDGNVDADRILFISFTKKAAGEIEERVEALLPQGSKVPNIFTFNAFGYRLLKDNQSLLGRQLCLASETDRRRMVEQCLPKVPKINGFSYQGARLERGIVNTAAVWMDAIMTNGEEAFCRKESKRGADVEGILALYKEYLALYKAGNYITFTEQITLALELVKKHPEVAKELADRYRYIMVDEFQDTNGEQAELIYTIARYHNNLVVVGDDDQNIYEWRGGSADYMLNFDKDFPGAEIVHMSDNFRSNNKILDAANALIENNSTRFAKNLVAHREAENKPLFYPAANADTAVRLVRTLLTKYRPGEIALLSRKNSTLSKLEPVLSQVCKVSKSKEYLVDDYVFRMVYDILGCYRDIRNDVSFYRLLRHFGAEVPAKETRSNSLYQNLIESRVLMSMDIMEPDDFYAYKDKEERTPLEEAAYRIFKAMKACQYHSTMEDLFDKVCDALDIPRNQIVVNQIRELADFHAFENIGQLHDYMTAMYDYSDTTKVDYTPDMDTLPLMTCHDSKGKEFPCVILYGTEDFVESEEDNRVLYVAMTRAKNSLIMLRTDISKDNENLARIGEYLLCR